MVAISPSFITVKRGDGSLIGAQFWSVSGPDRRWVVTEDRKLLEVRFPKGCDGQAREIQESVPPELRELKESADRATERRRRYLERQEFDRRHAWRNRHQEAYREPCESCGAMFWRCIVYGLCDVPDGICEFGGCREQGVEVMADGRLMCEKDANFTRIIDKSSAA